MTTPARIIKKQIEECKGLEYPCPTQCLEAVLKKVQAIPVHEPIRDALTNNRHSNISRQWRPNSYEKCTQNHDILKVRLGFDWHYEVLVHCPWDETPHYIWPRRGDGWDSPEEAMKAAEKAARRAKKTTSKEEFEKLFKDQP